MKNFILLIQFFTRIPINSKIEYNEEKYGKQTYLLPLVGAIIGFFIYLTYKVFLIKFPNEFKGLIIVFAWIIITGGLHLDGLADSSDGLFSYRKKEKILEIMRDPRIGTNGVIGVVLAILSKYFLYANTPITGIFLSFILGRTIIILSASFGNYARKDGMAQAIIRYNDYKTFIGSLGLLFLFLLIIKGFFICAVLTILISFTIHKSIIRKIGGITGDTLGFICEISEIIFLFLIYLGGYYELFRLY